MPNLDIPSYMVHVGVGFRCECGKEITCMDTPKVKVCRCGRQYTIRAQAQIEIATEILDLTPFDVVITSGPDHFVGQHAKYDPHSQCIQPDSLGPNHWVVTDKITWERIATPRLTIV